MGEILRIILLLKPPLALGLASPYRIRILDLLGLDDLLPVYERRGSNMTSMSNNECE